MQELEQQLELGTQELRRKEYEIETMRKQVSLVPLTELPIVSVRTVRFSLTAGG